ncbi:3843_t:CDS:1, partial [Dentiscutata erythropus]
SHLTDQSKETLTPAIEQFNIPSQQLLTKPNKTKKQTIKAETGDDIAKDKDRIVE